MNNSFRRETDMRKKINYSVVIDGTVVGTRKSHRTYTHAIVVSGQRISETQLSAGNNHYVSRYCGSEALAEKALRNEFQATYGGRPITTWYGIPYTDLTRTIAPVTLNQEGA
jgi:hypothetical protein